MGRIDGGFQMVAKAIAFLLLLPLPLGAHDWADRTNFVLHAVSASLMTADLVTTEQALKKPGTYEVNPLGQTNAARIGLKVGAGIAGVGLSYALHRTGHHRAERAIPLVFGIPSGVCAVHNARVGK